MWPCAARAANAAVAGSTPSRAVEHVGDRVGRRGAQPDRAAAQRMVGRRSSGEGAHSIHTVRGGGSSIALSSALAGRHAWSVEPVGVLDDEHVPAAAGR